MVSCEEPCFTISPITSKRLPYFLPHFHFLLHFFFFHFFFIFSTQTCPRIDQNQGKIRACCYNRDVKILHKGVPFFSVWLSLSRTITQLGSTEFSPACSFSPFFPLPFFLILTQSSHVAGGVMLT